MSLGFTKSKANSNLYYKVEDDMIMILLVYVDYLFLTGKEKLISECKKKLALKFKSKDISMMHYFLGLEVWKFPNEIFLNQGKYVVDILKRFGMLECKAMNSPMVTNMNILNDDSLERVDLTLYRWIIGSVMHFKNTVPDICFVVNKLSQYMVDMSTYL